MKEKVLYGVLLFIAIVLTWFYFSTHNESFAIDSPNENISAIQSLIDTNEIVKQYYRIQNNILEVLTPNNLYSPLGQISETLGFVKTKDTSNNFSIDTDIRSLVNFVDKPPQWSANWVVEFIKIESSKTYADYGCDASSEYPGFYACKLNIDSDTSVSRCEMQDAMVTENICPPSSAPYIGSKKDRLSDLLVLDGLKLFIKTKTGQEELGTVNDADIGKVKVKDGTLLPIGDVLTLVAGPSESFAYTQRLARPMCSYRFEMELRDYLQRELSEEEFKILEEFDFLGIGKFFRRTASTVANVATDVGGKIANVAKDLGGKIADTATTAYNWTKDRANDVANFTINATNTVGDWAKGAADSTINWAKGAGNLIAKELINIGNQISDVARSAFRTIANTANSAVSQVKGSFELAGKAVAGVANKIADGVVKAAEVAAGGIVDAAMAVKNFVMDFPALAMKAVNAVLDFLKSAAEKVWNFLKPILAAVITAVSGGKLCEYLLQKETSDDEAAETVILLVSPALREPFKSFSVQTINIIVPGISIVWPIVKPLVDPQLDPQLDKLLLMALKGQAKVLINFVDPIVQPLSFSCPFSGPPEGVSDYDTIISSTDFAT
jgi:hypothetical protein